MPVPAGGNARAGPRPPIMTRRAALGTRTRLRSGHGHRWSPLLASAGTALAFAALTLAAPAPAERTLPYVPTTILLSTDGNSSSSSSSIAYIFTPRNDGTGAVDFLSLDISSTLQASSLEPKTLASDLPFLSSDGERCTAFAPTVLRNGTLLVAAGDCASSSTASSSSLWAYAPDSGAWTRHAVAPTPSWDNAQSGPYHLGGILAFSAQLSPVVSEPTVYLYGGMCPSASSSTSSSSDSPAGQSSATYSSRMLRLSPPSSSSSDGGTSGSSSSSYTLTYASSTGAQQPVPHAGFTLMELPASLSAPPPSSSPGNRVVVTQQTTHLVLGGHTARAFVNMSTAAVWSLPEESWTFVGIAPPSPPPPPPPPSDLAAAVRAEEEAVRVDSRSGHTAVLSADGAAVVVYGGWVGDPATPAEPQLLVLRMGAAGGFAGWRWEVPPPASPGGGGGGGGGVYGHGAALLPGNVMMVWGGYEIGDGGTRRRRTRQAGGRMFFNVTSLSWSDEYINPLGGESNGGGDGDRNDGGGSDDGGDGEEGGAGEAPPIDGEGAGTDDSSRGRQIGLGVGLGVGLFVLLILTTVVVRFFYRRHRRRGARDAALRGLAQGVNGSLPRGLGDDDDEMVETDHAMGFFPWTAAAAREWYTGGGDPYAQGQRSLGYESLRGGARSLPSLYIPPPPSSAGSGSRPRGARGLYTPSVGLGSGSAYDFAPLARGPNRIEPIYEADEDEDGEAGGAACPLSPDREDDNDDPFLTPSGTDSPVGGLFPPPSISTASPTSRSLHTPSPDHSGSSGGGGRGQEQDPDVQTWVSDVDAADSILAARIAQRRSASVHRPAAAAAAVRTTTAPTTPPRQQPQHQQQQHSAARGGGSPSRRLSTRSGRSARSAKSGKLAASGGGGADSDSGRTGSNLSERSALSFAPSVGGGAAGSSPGGSSYSTAKSHLGFAALRNEGPALLMGGGGTTSTSTTQGASAGRAGDGEGEYYYVYDKGEEELVPEEEDYIPVPGSPSKEDRRSGGSGARRSWFGSLRRVFSGGAGTPETERGGSGREDSPTREGLLSTSDYDRSRPGAMTLHKRRRLPHQEGERVGGGGGGGWGAGEDGNGEEGEWDIERAVEQRLVQVMFTVPKERLRVVNAEVEREEEQTAVVVDPDNDGDGDGGKPSASASASASTPALTDEPLRLRPAPPRPESRDRDRDRDRDADRNRLSTATPELSLQGGGGISPSPSLRASSITTSTLHTAEAVRLERPRRGTRVLEMVETIESRHASSRESSPGVSPARGAA